MALTKKQQEHIIHSVNQAAIDGKVVYVSGTEVYGAMFYDGEVSFIRATERSLRVVGFDNLEKQTIRAWLPTQSATEVIYAPAPVAPPVSAFSPSLGFNIVPSIAPSVTAALPAGLHAPLPTTPVDFFQDKDGLVDTEVASEE